MLVAFGANVTAVGDLTHAEVSKLTPIPLAMVAQQSQDTQNKATPAPHTTTVNTKSGMDSEEKKISREEVDSEITQLLQNIRGIIPGEQPHSEPLHPYNIPVPCNDNECSRKLFKNLTESLSFRARAKSSIGGIESTNYAAGLQQKMIARFERTGSRILCLDGGGMKGLVELDVMESTEQQTGKSIAELFDWIVGTSTGGILALGLVYGE